MPLVWRAAERLGVGAGAAGPAEAAGLFELGARARFRHPLVRSAIYQTALVSEREAVHRALAEVTDPEADPDRRAWHRAQATAGLDEEVAGELERSAGRAQGRGGIAATAAFLERAAELTPDPVERGTRALAAARAKLDAGAPEAAEALLATAELAPVDELQRARSELLRAQIAFARTRGGDTPALFLHAARRLEPLDAAIARETYLEAMESAMFAGRLGGEPSVREVAEAARAAPAAPQPPRAIDLLLDGLATRFTEGYTAAVPALRGALDAFRRDEAPSLRDVRWLWLACRVAQDLWDDETWYVLATGGCAWRARRARSGCSRPRRRIARLCMCMRGVRRRVVADRGDRRHHPRDRDRTVKYARIWLAAWRGEEAEGVAFFDAITPEGRARREGMGLGLVWWGTALLYNGNGRYAEALTAARRACEHEDVGRSGGRSPS